MEDIDDKTLSADGINGLSTNDNKYNGKILLESTDDEVTDSNESGGEMISKMEIDDFKMSDMKDRLLDSVAKSDGFFKSQQVGEVDLTFFEKREIASNLLMKNMPLFLQRYWKFIELEDVPYFHDYRSIYEVNFYVSEIVKSHNSKISKIRIKNRRYEALMKMVDEGSYFSDAEMKKRSPFLYDQMIGQHLTESERIAAYKQEHPDENFSAFLMSQIEKNEENCLFDKQKNEDEAIVEEEDDDSSSEEESELEDDEPVKKVVTGEERKLLRSEFTNIMYESFLDGKDTDFDYSSVDNNVEFDSVLQRDIDEQEKYFDEESSYSSD